MSASMNRQPPLGYKFTQAWQDAPFELGYVCHPAVSEMLPPPMRFTLSDQAAAIQAFRAGDSVALTKLQVPMLEPIDC